MEERGREQGPAKWEGRDGRSVHVSATRARGIDACVAPSGGICIGHTVLDLLSDCERGAYTDASDLSASPFTPHIGPAL